MFTIISCLFHWYSINMPPLSRVYSTGNPSICNDYLVSIPLVIHQYATIILCLFHWYSINMPPLSRVVFISISISREATIIYSYSTITLRLFRTYVTIFSNCSLTIACFSCDLHVVCVSIYCEISFLFHIIICTLGEQCAVSTAAFRRFTGAIFPSISYLSLYAGPLSAGLIIATPFKCIRIVLFVLILLSQIHVSPLCAWPDCALMLAHKYLCTRVSACQTDVS
jgi:hypothetical protein